ncbi:hypothetical protein [Kitasatospora aureofaciens]|uniref:hypothetical protein n=1 Tax=Kitasatospora aureofaciens TaxID=1894 RepID=UPI003816648F
MATNSEFVVLVVSGLFSLAVAGVTYYTARATSRTHVEGELKKIKKQIEAQQAVEERGAIANLRQCYLTPLRYYAHMLSQRLAELEAKFKSDENTRVRDWFKEVKDHATRDNRRHGFAAWANYEGVFSLSTLYYTCSYFRCAHEVRFRRPFVESRPSYCEELDTYLARVTDAFAWDALHGLWDVSQETIGERFTTNGAKMTYAEMCDVLDSENPFPRAAYFRPLDFYWKYLNAEKALDIKASLDELVEFLDSHDPQIYDLAKAIP